MNLWKRLLIAIGAPLGVALLLALVSAPPAFTQAQLPAGPKPPPSSPPPTPVLVTNAPLLIREVDESRPRAFSTIRQLLYKDAFTAFPTETLDIPAGFRLEIEHVSVQGEVPPGQRLVGVVLSTLLNGEYTPSFIGTKPNGHSPTGGLSDGNEADIFSANTDLHAAVDAGANNFQFKGFRGQSPGPANIFVTLHGQLVRAP